MSKLEEIKDCPFCGNGNPNCDLASSGWIVECSDCPANYDRQDSKSAAIAGWNRRAALESEPAVEPTGLANDLRRRYGHEFRIVEDGDPGPVRYDLSSHPLVAHAIRALTALESEPHPCEDAARADLLDKLEDERLELIERRHETTASIIGEAIAWIDGERDGAALESAEPPPCMSDQMRTFIEGMSVSVDVSTGEHDAGHRYFGTVSEVMDDLDDKHGVTLLVQDAKPNFESAPKVESAEPVARQYRYRVHGFQEWSGWIDYGEDSLRRAKENTHRYEVRSLYASPPPESAALRALRELVELKALKDTLDERKQDVPTFADAAVLEGIAQEYQRRKPAAWEAARAVV